MVKRNLLISLVVLIFAGGVYSYYNFVYRPASLLKALPDIDLTGVEKQVSEEIENRRQTVMATPTVDTTWGRLAMILDIHGFKRESVPCYKHAIKLNPDSFKWNYFCGIVLSDLGSAEALQYFQKCQKMRPEYFPLYIHYGQALLKAGSLRDAYNTLQTALSLDSTSSHANWGMAQVQLAKSNLDSSLIYLDKAIEIDPENGELYGARANVLRRLGNDQEAAKALQLAQKYRVKKKIPDPVYMTLIEQGISTTWYRDRALTYEAQGEFEKAIQEIRTAMALRPDPNGYNHLGAILQRTGHYSEAIQAFQKTISLAPNHIIAYMNLGETFLKTGRPTEAVKWFEKSIRIKPDLPDAYLKLSDTYLNLNRPADAIYTLRKGMKRTQGNLSIALHLAWLLSTEPDSKLRNGSEAVQLAKLACEVLKFTHPQALDILAASYAEQGQFKLAIEYAKKADSLAVRIEPYKEMSPQIQSRISLYSNKKPYRRKERVTEGAN